MRTNYPDIPARYQQPIRDFIGRDVEGGLERVDFVPEHHVRIWYNVQAESYATHHHEALEIVLCIENPYEIVAGNRDFQLNAGDILIVPPNMFHAINCRHHGVRFIFQISPMSLAEFNDFKLFEPLFLSALRCNSQTHPEIYELLRTLLLHMVELYFDNQVFWEYGIYADLMQFFSALGRHYYARLQNEAQPEGKTAGSANFGHENFSALLSYINTHFDEELSLARAAGFVGFSKYHFTRLFKQYTDMSFYDYLSHKRIQEAQKLLAGQRSITDIAFMSGFNSLSAFCRCFKKYTGLSPSEYRTLWNESHTNALSLEADCPGLSPSHRPAPHPR